MNERQRPWQLAAVVVATLVAGVLLGRTVLTENAPDFVPLIVAPTTSADLSQSQQDTAAARRRVRAAIPAAEVFFADHETYREMTLADLRRLDAGIDPRLLVSFALDTSYCLESTVGKETASYLGPAGPLRHPRRLPRPRLLPHLLAPTPELIVLGALRVILAYLRDSIPVVSWPTSSPGSRQPIPTARRRAP